VSVLKDIRGVADLDYDHEVGMPELRIAVDRTAAARYGINVQDVQDVLEAATKGRTVGPMFEGERRFDIVLKLAKDSNSVAALRTLMISAPNGERIPVTQLAEFTRTEGLAEIVREANARRVVVKWSVRERDMGGLVNEAMQKVNAAVKLPEGYRMVWS